MRSSAFVVALVVALGLLDSAHSTLSASATQQKPAVQTTVLVVKGMT